MTPGAVRRLEAGQALEKKNIWKLKG
jgi:hypothetical protein